MSYREKYHNKKVEPVKSRPKPSNTEFVHMLQKIQKASTYKGNLKKRKIPVNHKNSQPRQHYQLHKTEKHIRNYEQQERVPMSKRMLSPTEMLLERPQSLNFKSTKNIPKIINTIQNFFINKIIKPSEGCRCDEPCQWKVRFMDWVGASQETINKHFNGQLQKIEKFQKYGEYKNKLKSQGQLFPQKKSKSDQMLQYFKQVEKDIHRTQSESQTFKNQSFRDKLRKVLKAYACEDHEVGYVQGMNMIASGILFHTKQEQATYGIFRKFIILIRQIYLKNFQECYKHIQNIKKYMKKHVNDLYLLFEDYGLEINTICLPWVLTILTSFVPLRYLHYIYDGFIKEKWRFLYKLVLGIFIFHKEEIKEMRDEGEILTLLSPSNEHKDGYDWEDIIQFSCTIIL